MDCNCLMNTEELVPAVGPLCSEAEGKTLKDITDGTLLKNIDGLPLRVSTTIICSFPYVVASIQVLTSFILFCKWLFWSKCSAGEEA